MSQAHFAYAAPANDTAEADCAAAKTIPARALSLTVSIFADRTHLRDQMRDDAQAAGFHLGEVAPVSRLLQDDARALGNVVLLDCPVIDGAGLAALARLDLRAAQCGAHLVVSTTVAALDDVFACLDQSAPQILVDPGRADRVIALGRALGLLAPLHVRELSADDRLMLLRLTEQVGQIAERLDWLGTRAGSTATTPPLVHARDADGPLHASLPAGDVPLFRFESPRPAFAGQDDDAADRLVVAVAAQQELPNPRMIRRIIRQRQLRARFFDGDLFADPAWDMLLDLTAARAERSRVSVTSLCIASNVPPTTALRWIGQLTDAGLVQRVEDETDRRRAFIALTDRAADGMARFFAELGSGAARLI